MNTDGRCINIDWLEVHVLEPVGHPHDPDYYRSRGYTVDERAYGTRVYRQMFTVNDVNGKPFVEVRRDPASQGLDGIHLPEESHLRLVNAACYYDDAAARLRDFIELEGYEFRRITRVDICLDFERFDTNDDPQRFIERYFKGFYSKINQGNIHAHGTDSWNGQQWHSVSWGSPSSDIGTKMYNKTIELYDPHTHSFRKPYIRYAWLKSRLVDDYVQVLKTVGGETYRPMIWRIEFSIRSSVKNWFAIELNGKRKAYQSVRNTLDMYETKEKLITLFASLSNHYFHFKHYHESIRKDRCPDKVLFRWYSQQLCYKVGREIDFVASERKHARPLASLIAKLREYSESKTAVEIHRAAAVLIEAMERDNLRAEMEHPWSYSEMKALQLALQRASAGHLDSDVSVLLNELRKFLRLNDNIGIF